MTFDGAGTKSSPIFIQDSEEEFIQELSYQQFYGSSSSTGKYDTTQHSTHQPPSMPGKRKCREDDESLADTRSDTLTPSTSLENRISQPESKKARKRRRRAMEALERNKLQNTEWLDDPDSFPPAAGPSQPPLQARMKADRQSPDFEGILRENQADMGLHDYVPPSSSSTFDSDWVSSMVIAGEFPHCKKVKTPINVSPRPAPRQLPAFNPLPEVLPPIHIYPDLMVATEVPVPPQAPQQALLQPIGMRHEQDPKSDHGIFHTTDSTKESGSGIDNRMNPYIPNPTRTLVMEKLPKSHRTTEFVTSWCRSACGVSPLHLFVDPPSAKALIEFGSTNLARKAWASPRLGRGLLGRKTSLLKGMPREDQIRVWWLREIEEGEIEEDRVTENRAPQPPSSPRKESKKERKARLSKLRETKATKNQQQQQQQKQKQKNLGNSSNSAQPVHVSTSAPVQATSSQVHIPPAQEVPSAFPRDPTMGTGSLFRPWQHLSAQSAPQVQSATNPYFPTPSPYSTTLMTGVGSSLTPGARGGHDDTTSIASSGSRSSPECHWSRQTAVAVAAPSAKITVEATNVRHADELADYSEEDMDVDRRPPRGRLDFTTPPPPTSEKATPSTAIQPQQSSWKDDTLVLQPVIPSRPCFTSATRGEKPRSKQLQPHRRPPFAHTPNLATAHRPAVLPFSLENKTSSYQPQQCSPPSSLSPGLAPISHVSNASQRHPLSSIPPKLYSVPNLGAHANNSPLPSEPKVTANSSKHAASVRSKLDKQMAKGNMELLSTWNPTSPASSHPAPSPVPAPVTTSLSSSDSAGQAMEENLRQLVFASKRARVSAVQPHSSQRHSSTSADVNVTLPAPNSSAKVLPANDDLNRAQSESHKAVSPNTVETSVSTPPSAKIPPTSNSKFLNQSTTDTFSFEDLAITFITQTIENVKANNIDRPQPDPQSANSSLTSTLTSASGTPSNGAVVGFSSLTSSSASSNASAGGVTPDKLPLATNSSNLTKSELSAKQSRLEKHLQETKSLMERLTTAKTKREKDLLLKFMNEKMRLFEEENKASEKKIARQGNPIKKSAKDKMQMTLLQFQQWPTIQSNPVLVLSDDED